MLTISTMNQSGRKEPMEMVLVNTSKVIRYHNRRVYCGLEYIRQVIDGTIKVDEEFREILLSMFQ